MAARMITFWIAGLCIRLDANLHRQLLLVTTRWICIRWLAVSHLDGTGINKKADIREDTGLAFSMATSNSKIKFVKIAGLIHYASNLSTRCFFSPGFNCSALTGRQPAISRLGLPRCYCSAAGCWLMLHCRYWHWASPSWVTSFPCRCRNWSCLAYRSHSMNC